MISEGIIVGCDRNQEWLLPWWWNHYSSHNTYPILFTDFGMSEQALSWCKARGECASAPLQPSLKPIHSDKRAQWEADYGTSILHMRPAWFKKPLALLHAPFTIGLWLDLDCQVKGDVEPLFNALCLGADIALVPEPEYRNFEKRNGYLLPDEVNYNSGVIAFRKNAPILHHWAQEILINNEQYVTDQQALSRTIFLHKPLLIELPLLYNLAELAHPNPHALISHFSGGAGKIELLQQMELHYTKK